jgi:hypothetical protein
MAEGLRMDKARGKRTARVQDEKYLSELEDQLGLNESQLNELRQIVKRESYGILFNIMVTALILIAFAIFLYSALFHFDIGPLERLKSLAPTGGVVSILLILDQLLRLAEKAGLVRKLRFLIQRQLSAIDAAQRELRGGGSGAR